MGTKEEEVTTSKVKPGEEVKRDKKTYQQHRSRGRRVNRREPRDPDRQSQGEMRSSSSSSADKGKFDVTSDVLMTLDKANLKPNLTYSFESKLPEKLPGSWASLVAGGSGTLANSFVPSFPEVTLSQESIEVKENKDPIIVEQNRLLIYSGSENKKIL